MYKALKAWGAGMQELNDIDHISMAVLLQKGLDESGVSNVPDVLAVIQKLAESHAQHIDQIREKVSGQYKLMSDEVSALKLPTYQTDDDSKRTESDLDKFFLTLNELIGRSSKIANKIRNFKAAVKTCCGDLAGLEIEHPECDASLGEVHMFIYTFTMVNIINSSTWKSISKETYEKTGSKQEKVVNDTIYTIKQAKVDQVELPKSLVERCSSLLAQAGVSLPE